MSASPLRSLRPQAVNEKTARQSKHVWWIEALKILFFTAYISALGAGVYFARPFWLLKQEESKLRQERLDFRSVLPPFDNQPWKETFDLAGRLVFPALVKTEDGKLQLEGIALRADTATLSHTYHLLIGLKISGEIAGVRMTGLSGRDGFEETLQADSPFFLSLEGRTRADLPALEGANVLIRQAGSRMAAEKIVDAVKESITFFFDHRAALLQKYGVIQEKGNETAPAPAEVSQSGPEMEAPLPAVPPDASANPQTVNEDEKQTSR